MRTPDGYSYHLLFIIPLLFMKIIQPPNPPAPGASSSPDPNDRFEQLYRQYVDTVFRTCLSMTKDELIAQTCTHAIPRKTFGNRATNRPASLLLNLALRDPLHPAPDES
jgi:hypothetical protein